MTDEEKAAFVERMAAGKPATKKTRKKRTANPRPKIPLASFTSTLTGPHLGPRLGPGDPGKSVSRISTTTSAS